MENDDCLAEPVTRNTDRLKVLGRSFWNEGDGSISFDWPGTQLVFRVLGSPAEVTMSASLGEDLLAVYANDSWQGHIGPGNGKKEAHLLVRDVPEDCEIRIVKTSESNMEIPVTIYDILASPSGKDDGVAPCIAHLKVEGRYPDHGAMMEFVGDSDTSALYNLLVSGCERADYARPSDSNIERGWPFFLAEKLGIACPSVVALSGVGIHAGPHREKSMSDYYPRVLCCRENPHNLAPRNDIFADESGPLCIFVFVGGNDLVALPRDSPLPRRRLFLQELASAHQALLCAIRHHRPRSPIVSLYCDARSCSGCGSVAEQEWVSSNMREVVASSVAGLGGASHGFFSCMIQPDIRPTDWAYDMHWNANAHRKVSDAIYEALWALVQCDGAESEQCWPAMARLAAVVLQQAAADRTPSTMTTSIPAGEALSSVRPQRGVHPQSNPGQINEMQGEDDHRRSSVISQGLAGDLQHGGMRTSAIQDAAGQGDCTALSQHLEALHR